MSAKYLPRLAGENEKARGISKPNALRRRRAQESGAHMASKPVERGIADGRQRKKGWLAPRASAHRVTGRDLPVRRHSCEGLRRAPRLASRLWCGRLPDVSA